MSRQRPRVILGFVLNVVTATIMAAVPATGRADLHFAEPMANAGVVYAGSALTHEFLFENQGPETVAVIEARTTCGCLKPRLAQTRYRPGEKGSVLLEVNTLSQAAGPHTWAVALSYQTGNVSHEMLLRLNARLVSEVTVQPAALIVFADKLARHELVLIDSRAKSLEILGVHATSDKLVPRVGEPSRDARGTVRKISLAVTDDYPDGRYEEILAIYTDDPRYRELRLPVTIIKHAQQRLAATPNQVELVAPAGQAFPSGVVLIRDNEEQRVHIEQILADDPAIVCQWAPGPGAMATLRIRVQRTVRPGENFLSAIHVRIDEPVREILAIPVTCTVR